MRMQAFSPSSESFSLLPVFPSLRPSLLFRGAPGCIYQSTKVSSGRSEELPFRSILSWPVYGEPPLHSLLDQPAETSPLDFRCFPRLDSSTALTVLMFSAPPDRARFPSNIALLLMILMRLFAMWPAHSPPLPIPIRLPISFLGTVQTLFFFS